MQLPGLQQGKDASLHFRQQALQVLSGRRSGSQALRALQHFLRCDYAPAAGPSLRAVSGRQGGGCMQGALLNSIPNTVWQLPHDPSPLNKG